MSSDLLGETPSAPTPTPLQDDEKVLALVKTGIAQVVDGKISLADLFQAVMAPEDRAVAPKAPPPPVALTQEVKDALKRLPEIYGRIAPTVDRVLQPKERAALVEEREVIDKVLDVLKKRKDSSIREALANDFDHLLSPEQRKTARLDNNGHYAVKQEQPVPGTGKKTQRILVGGKPNLTIEAVERLHAEGKIDRATYLKVTRKPDVPRVLDEAGLHQAIQKNPRLFFLFGSVAEPTTPTTQIKVVDDK